MKLLCRLAVLGCASFLGLCLVGCGPSAPRVSVHQAAEKGDLKLVQQHIAAKSNLNKTNYSGWTPLHLAAMKGHLPVVEALVKAGADVNRPGKDNKTPVDVARESKQVAIVNFMLESNAPKPGRGLIDGGLGVGEVLDAQ
jgi:ankyrin repeat protein